MTPTQVVAAKRRLVPAILLAPFTSTITLRAPRTLLAHKYIIMRITIRR
jgi:hypothetical protein